MCCSQCGQENLNSLINLVVWLIGCVDSYSIRSFYPIPNSARDPFLNNTEATLEQGYTGLWWRGLTCQHGKQISQFLLDLLLTPDRVRDLFAQQGTIPLPQTMHRHLHRALAHADSASELGVGQRMAFTGQAVFQQIKQRSLARRDMFLTQPRQHLFEQRQRPAPLENFVGGKGVDRLQTVA